MTKKWVDGVQRKRWGGEVCHSPAATFTVEVPHLIPRPPGRVMSSCSCRRIGEWGQILTEALLDPSSQSPLIDGICSRPSLLA